MKVKPNLKPIHELNSTTHPATPHNGAITPTAPVVQHVFQLGLDVDLHAIVTATQWDHGPIKPARKFTREQLLAWVQAQVAVGHAVHTVYESCGFGYTLHPARVAAGAASLLTTPLRLHAERRRKNDRLDARALCVRLSRWLDGNRQELAPLRVPSVAEQQRRETGRQREFWKRELFRLENHGRALRVKHQHQSLDANWAGPRKWKPIAPALSEFVRAQLEPVAQQIRHGRAHPRPAHARD